MAAGVSLGLLPEGGQLDQSSGPDRDAPVEVVPGAGPLRRTSTADKAAVASGWLWPALRGRWLRASHRSHAVSRDAADWRPDAPGDIVLGVLTLTGILVGLAIVALALAVAAFVVPGIECDGPVGLLLAAFLYQALQVGIWWLLPAVAFGPLGLLGPVGGILIGTLLLWLVGQIVPGYQVNGLGSALIGAILIKLAGFAAGAVFMFLPEGPFHPTP